MREGALFRTRTHAIMHRTMRRMMSSSARDRVVFVDGVRTPFHPSGTHFDRYLGQELGRLAIQGLLARTAIEPSSVDYVTYGTVIQEGENQERRRFLCP